MTVDAVGRVVIPKAMRDALGLKPGSKVDLSWYGTGIQITPHGRGAHLETNEHGELVAVGEGVLTDEEMYRLIDEGRR